MSETRTFQTMCPMNCHPTLCGMTVTVQDNRLLQIAGDPQNPDSEGFLCMRGNAAHQIVGNPQRLDRPLWRDVPGQGDWQAISWETALDRIAQAMRAVEPAAVGLWQSHGNAVNDYGFGLKRGQAERFANLYGCQHWNPSMICWGLGGFGFGLTGATTVSTKEDMSAHSNLIVLWGANTVSQANTIKHVERARQRGAKVVVIDVRRTEASALASEVVLLRPGTDTALALGLMHVILRDGLQDKGFLAAHTLGAEDMADHVAPFTPDWTEARTGVPAAQVEGLARLYAQTDPAMIVAGGSSLHKGDNAWHAARAIACLPAVTGQYGRAGGGLGPRHGARCKGAELGDIRASDRKVPLTRIPNQMEAILEALEQGKVQVLLGLGANVLSAFPDSNRTLAALRRAKLVVAYDIFHNQTTREAAHLVLPGTIWLEEIGAKATNTHVYLSDRALQPAGNVRPLHALYQGLASRLGVADVYPWPDQEAAMNAVLDHPSTGHATVADLRRMGGRVALRIDPVAYRDHAFDTPSGKIEFVSQRAADMGLPALPAMPPDPALDPDAPLILAHGRSFAHFHSFYDHGRALPSLARRETRPELWIAPEDARARGLEDGAPLRLRNARGQFDAFAKATPRIPAGTVWIRDGWPGLNALTDSRAVLPEAALEAFAFGVGQSGYGARVEVQARATAD